MKKDFLSVLTLLALLLVVLAAGCTAKDDTGDATAGTTKPADEQTNVDDGNKEDTSELTTSNQVEEAKAEDGNKAGSSEIMDADSKDREALGDSEDTLIAGTAKEMFPDAEINPLLADMKIAVNSKYLELKKLELLDNRTNEGSDDWAARATFEYTGEGPAFMTIQLRVAKDRAVVGHDSTQHLTTYEKGDQVQIEASAKRSKTSLDEDAVENEMIVLAVAHKKGTPEIAPELKNLGTIGVYAANMFVDVTDVYTIQSEQNAEWKTVVVRLQQPSQDGFRTSRVSVVLTDASAETLKYEDGKPLSAVAEFNGNTTAEARISLGSMPADAICGIKLEYK